MKFTKGAFGQTERFQHWLAPFDAIKKRHVAIQVLHGLLPQQ
jgi:hypothetical protein